jgi:hypothetical protein
VHVGTHLNKYDGSKPQITRHLCGQTLTVNERDAAGALLGCWRAEKRVRTIKLRQRHGAYICVKGQEARNGLEGKECDVDGSQRRRYVVMIERGSSSHWTNLMELKAFDRRVYST